MASICNPARDMLLSGSYDKSVFNFKSPLFFIVPVPVSVTGRPRPVGEALEKVAGDRSLANSFPAI